MPRPTRHGASIAALPPLLALVVSIASLAVGGCRAGAGDEAASAPYWIWRDHDLRHVEATAFYAVLDADLRPLAGEAYVRVVADEEYVLFLNGVRIASGRWASGGPGDEVDVGSIVRPGRNRIVVELRSSTGAGGLWFELADATGTLARSDRSWSIYRGEWRGLLRGGAMPPGERPLVLGQSPLGRWGPISRFRRLPSFEGALSSDEPVPAIAFREWGSDGAWRPAPERRRRATSFGPLVEIDFGELRTGYLQLAFRDPATGRTPPPALVVFGERPFPPPPLAADAVLRPILGRNLYQDSVPRRFRYVAVAGLPGLFGAEVLSVRDDAFERLRAADAAALRGVFGVTPPPRSRAPVEHEVWRELERSTGLVLREDR